MIGMNRVTIIGNLGRDPEIKFTNGGKQYASLSVATHERWRDKASGETKEATEWHRVVIWNPNLLKVVEQYLNKGEQVLVEGKLQTRKWTKQDGSEQYTTEIVVNNFDGKLIMLGGGTENKTGGAPAKYPSDNNQSLAQELDDEIPF